MSDERERRLRWMEFLWERYNSIVREEKRKAEVLGIFESINELSKRPVEEPSLPLWESS